MNFVTENQCKEQAPPQRDLEFMKILEEHAADLRALMEKLRSKLD